MTPPAAALGDLEDTGHLAQIKFLIRDRDAKYPALIDKFLGAAGIATVPTGVQMPRMDSVIERWSRHSAPNCWTAR